MLTLPLVAFALFVFLRVKTGLVGLRCHGFMGYKGALIAMMGVGRIFLVVLAMALAGSTPAYSQFTIQATFGSGIPPGSPARDSINSAIALYQSLFTDPITVTIKFDTGSLLPLSQTAKLITTRSYSDYIDALKTGPRSADDSIALGILAPGGITPVNDPVKNNPSINISSANERASGLTVTGAPVPDATITFSNAYPFYYRTTATPNPEKAIASNEYDFLAIVEHEINEALGLGSNLTCIAPTCVLPDTTITQPLDLFRYGLTSTKISPLRSFTIIPTRAFFSIDGDVVAANPGFAGAPGTTPEFNNQDNTSDFNDWVTGTGVQDAVSPPGRIANLSPNEIRALDAIGYDLVGATRPPLVPPTPGPVTNGGVILSPTGAVVDSGGTSLGDIRDTINQNGLSFGFMSGITDFNSYLTSTPGPVHTTMFINAEWFSVSKTATVTYDLGKVYSVDRLAFWNEEVAGVGRLDLSYSLDDVTFASLASGLLPTDNTGQYMADVFSFIPANARYIRLDMSDCPQPIPAGRQTCGVGEVAFEVNPSKLPVASRVTLTPLTAINNVGTNHTVTVTATSSTGTPAPGETVTVTILTGPNAGLVLTGVTDINGKAIITYPDTGGAGTDTIRATIRNLVSNIISKTWANVDAFVEVCKLSSNTNPVTGNFTFTSPSFVTLPNNSIMVPVGACSGPVPVEHGLVTITEALPPGVSLNAVVASGYNTTTTSQLEDRWVSSNLTAGTAMVTAVVGNAASETVAVFTNQGPTGQLKVCKIAGTGVAIGTSFNFTVTIPATATGPALSRSYTVPAGPASQGGYCVIDSDPLPVGVKATVTEVLPALSVYIVSSAASPSGAKGGRSIGVVIGAGFTQVTFTNSTFVLTCCLGGGVSWNTTIINSANTLLLPLTSTPPVDFTAVASVTSGLSNWLSVSPNRGTTPATLTLSALPLPVGIYTGALTITTADGLTVLSVPVTYTVAAPTPTLSITQTHQGNFTQGQTNATYRVTVSNAGAAGTTGTITVTDTVPDGLTLVSMSGVGWSCSGITCARSDVLAPGSSSAAITIAVNVLANAPPQLTNRITVSGGGSAAATSDDVTTIVAPTPVISLVANAEGESPIIAPNTWVEIKGVNLAPAGDTRIWQRPDFANGTMPTQLDGVSVTMNGRPAYVYYISPTQVNILTPPDPVQGSAQVQLTNNSATSAPTTVQARSLSPSFFVFNGGPYIAAQHANGSLLAPVPAKPGETVVLFANGFGATNVPVVSGSVVQSGTLLPMPAIKIGGIDAIVSFAGLVAPGQFQFNVQVPASLADGDQPITATYNGSTTQAGTLITIHH